MPPYALAPAVIDEIRRQTVALARGLRVVGLMNVQFAVKTDADGVDLVYVIEVNPRASRTVPFVAKATGVAIAKIGARVMAGERLADFGLEEKRITHVAVKEAVFPFARFPGVDVLLGPEMKSTGEVMGLDSDFGRAFAKSQIASGTRLPDAGTVFISVRDRDKPAMVPLGVDLVKMGFELIATTGTAAYLEAQGLEVRRIHKVREGRPHLVDAISDGEIALILNTTEGAQAIEDSYSLRRAALTRHVPYYTTVAGSRAVVLAIAALRRGALEVAPLQSYT